MAKGQQSHTTPQTETQPRKAAPEQKVPRWLKEISSDGPPPTHPIFDDGTVYVSVSADGAVTKHTAFPSGPPLALTDAKEASHPHQCPRRVAILRDGPIAKPSTGVAASLLGMTGALTTVAHCEVVLVLCLRGADDPAELTALADLCRANNPHFPFTEVVCVNPAHFYDNCGSPTGGLGALIARLNVAVCHFDSVEAVGWQAAGIRSVAGVRIVLDMFDVESVLGRWRDRRAEAEALERSAVSLADAVLVRSQQDKDALCALFMPSDKEAIRSKMFHYRGSIASESATEGAAPLLKVADLVYLGNMLYPPNADALLSLARALPSDISVLVVGRVDEALREACAQFPNVSFKGFVDNGALPSVLRSARFGVAPLSSHDGSGTSLKVLDYGTCGIPIIATPFAFRGLEEELLSAAVMLPEEDPAQWAPLIRRAIDDYATHAAAAATASAAFTEHRAWRNTIGHVVQAYGIPMPMPMVAKGAPYRVTIEGMPRCGKTTSLNRLKRLFPNAVFFEELQPTAEAEAAVGLADQPTGNLALSKWFIDAECDRATIGAQQFVIADRSYLCTLAYRYASAQVSGDPADLGDFAALRQYYLDRKLDLPVYDRVIVLDNEPLTTINRRGAEEQRLPTNGSWVTSAFMSHFRSFYTGPLLREFTGGAPVTHITCGADSSDVVFAQVLQSIITKG